MGRWQRHIGMGIILASAACLRPASDSRAAGSWSYLIDAPAEGSRTVVVEATFDNSGTDRIAIARESAPFVRDVQLKTHAGYSVVERRGSEWYEPACKRHCTVRYRIDLGELAAACGDEVDCARRVGDATLSPALAWLAHPWPKTDVPVFVHVRPPKPLKPAAERDSRQFISGMHATDDAGLSFSFRSFDLDEGSFTGFGPMRHYRVDAVGNGGPHGARVDVAVVGKTQYGMADREIREWVDDAATVVTSLFGRFPVDRATLFVVPARGENEVIFGKVLSLAGASVVLVVGDRMTAESRHHDWVLVHELFHLGFPTFRGEGRWLGEGLATYFEPVLRARAGWTTETEVYQQFARNMPRGMPARGSSAGLAQRDDNDSIYWGGALFCFAADVRIRAETKGKHSLDDVVRGALARGGDATQVWTVAEVVRVGDEVTGTKILSQMYERYAARGERIDIEGLFASLGVDRESSELDEQKPLAWVRRQIVGRTQATLAAKVQEPRP